jgi:hypothetical protein
MFKTNHISRRALGAFALTLAAAAVAPAGALAANSPDTTQFSVTGASLSFSLLPAMPTLTPFTLTGQAQTTNTKMTDFTVRDATGSGSGWNVTVNGDATGTNSPVFAQYCPNASCGTDSSGYINGGQKLAPNSLTLTGAGPFTAQNSSGAAPTLQCSSACNVDSATPVKIASAAVNAGMGTWATPGWSAASLALSTPTTLKTLPAGEVYHIDLVWSLTSGP